MSTGRVTAIKETRAGTELAADADAGDETLDVLNVLELDALGGRLQIGDEVIAYGITDGLVELEDALASSHDAEEPVLIYPPTVERTAYLRGPDQREELAARVPHSLHPMLPTGTRDDDVTAEVVETQVVEGGELVVTDVLAREPEGDIGFLDGFQINAGTVDIDTDPSPAVISDPIPHRLGRQPNVLIATVDHSFGKATSKVHCTVGGTDENSFKVKIRTDDGSNLSAPSGDNFIRVNWLAMYLDLIAGIPAAEGGDVFVVGSSATVT